MERFLETARTLSRNPLGIIALFIALIYGFATLLLGAAAGKLSCGERFPLVWFVILFPVLVLVAFYLLVTRHHWKLYAPRDYRTDAEFRDPYPLIKLTSAQQERRTNEELASVHAEVVQQPGPAVEVAHEKSLTALPTTDPDELRARISLAKKLALEKIQRERGLNIKIQVAFGDGASSAFDGVAQTGISYVAIEVKLLRGSWIHAERIREVLYRAMIADHRLNQRFGDQVDFRLLLVFVVEKGEADRRRIARLIEPTLNEAPLVVEWELYELTSLQSEFPDVMV